MDSNQIHFALPAPEIPCKKHKPSLRQIAGSLLLVFSSCLSFIQIAFSRSALFVQLGLNLIHSVHKHQDFRHDLVQLRRNHIANLQPG